MATRAIELLCRVDDDELACHTWYWRHYSAAVAGNFALASRCAAKIREVSERSPSRLRSACFRMLLAADDFVLGRWAFAERSCLDALSIVGGDAERFTIMAVLTILAMIRYETGRTAEGDDFLERLAAYSPRSGSPQPFAIPRISSVTGERERLVSAHADLDRMQVDEPPFGWARCSLDVACAWIAVLENDREAAGSWYSALNPRSGFLLPGGATGIVIDRLLGLLAGCRGDLDLAISHFRFGASFCRKAGIRPELAWIDFELAEALLLRGSDGDQDAVEPAIHEAESIATELSMTPLLGRLFALHPARLDPEDASKSRTTADGIFGLSEREFEVLAFAARGYTNREIGEKLFISPETVATHMRNLLRKTGMSNRTEATAFAVRQGIV
jgi:DNA-binding CsgD family transcriptional regulator